jgi:hypothetical protein
MKIERLPYRGEKPELFASVDYCIDDDEGYVVWCLYDQALDLNSDSDLYQVFRDDRSSNAVTVEATCWFHDRGMFRMTVSDLEPDQLVLLVDEHCNKFFEGN